MEKKEMNNVKIKKIIKKKKCESIMSTFRKSNKKRKIIYILGFIFLLFISVPGIYLLAILTKIISLSFFNEMIKSLGYDIATPWRYFLVVLFVMIIILVIKSFFIIFKNSNKKINWYSWACFGIFVFLLIFSLSFVKETYPPNLPQDIPRIILDEKLHKNFSDNLNCSITMLNCYSKTNKSNFVIIDEVWCNFSFNKNCSFRLVNLKTEKEYLDNDNLSTRNWGVGISSGHFYFNVEESLRVISVTPEFLIKDNKRAAIYKWSVYLDNKYTLQEYNQRKHDKTFLLITIISISLFSTIVAMNNLKQLLEKK